MRRRAAGSERCLTAGGEPGALWLRGAADSGDICASCCSAIVETLKVNYNINDSALQAVGPYYTSIIPCMSAQNPPPTPQTQTRRPKQNATSLRIEMEGWLVYSKGDCSQTATEALHPLKSHKTNGQMCTVVFTFHFLKVH